MIRRQVHRAFLEPFGSSALGDSRCLGSQALGKPVELCANMLKAGASILSYLWKVPMEPKIPAYALAKVGQKSKVEVIVSEVEVAAEEVI